MDSLTEEEQKLHRRQRQPQGHVPEQPMSRYRNVSRTGLWEFRAKVDHQRIIPKAVPEEEFPIIRQSMLEVYEIVQTVNDLC
jgi:hypothetical protein